MNRFALSVLAATLGPVSAFAMDCNLQYHSPDLAWTAACGISRTDGKWEGYIQGPLSGAKLSFRNSANQTVTIEGSALAGIPVANLEDLPFCANSPTGVLGQRCAKIAATIGLSVPFDLNSYSQEPSAFKLGSKWDAKAGKIAAGSELKVPTCDPKAEKVGKETDAIAEFRKTMDCHWQTVRPTLISQAGGGENNPLHPSFRPDQTFLKGDSGYVPDLYGTVAVGCGGKATGGAMKVCTGHIVCESRDKRLFPAERDPAKRAEQFADAFKVAGLPALADIEKAKVDTKAYEDRGIQNVDVKKSRESKLRILSDADLRNFTPRLDLKKDGYVYREESGIPHGWYGADILGGDVRRYIDPKTKNSDLDKLYDLMRVPKLARALGNIPLSAGAKGCAAQALGPTATPEDRALLAQLDEGIKNGGSFGRNETCVGVDEIDRARNYVTARMSLESIGNAVKADLWAGENSVTAAKGSSTLDGTKPSRLAKDEQYIDYETADWIRTSPEFHPPTPLSAAQLTGHRNMVSQQRNEITHALLVDNGADFDAKKGVPIHQTDKALITDPMEASCIPPDGKSCTPDLIDPITCFADTKIARMSQADLKAGTQVPGSSTPETKMKDAKSVFQAN